MALSELIKLCLVLLSGFMLLNRSSESGLWPFSGREPSEKKFSVDIRGIKDVVIDSSSNVHIKTDFSESNAITANTSPEHINDNINNKIIGSSDFCSNSFFSIVAIPATHTRCGSYLRQKLENVGILASIFEKSNSEFTIYVDSSHEKFFSADVAPTAYDVFSTCNISYNLPNVAVTFRALNASFEWLRECSLSVATAKEVLRWGLDPIDAERKSHITRICLARELLRSTYIDLEVLPFNVNNIISNDSYSIAVTLWEKPGFHFEFSNSIFCLPPAVLKSVSISQDRIIREHIAMKLPSYSQGTRIKRYSPIHHSKHRQVERGAGQGASSHSDYAVQELSHPVLQRALSNTHLSSLKILAQNPPGDLKSRRLFHLFDRLDLSHYLIIGDRSYIGHESNYNVFAQNLIYHAQNFHVDLNHYNRMYQTNSQLHHHRSNRDHNSNICKSAFSIIGDGIGNDCCGMLSTRQFQEMIIFHAMQSKLSGIAQSITYFVVRQSLCGVCEKELKRINELLSLVDSSYDDRSKKAVGTKLVYLDNHIVFADCLIKANVKRYDSYFKAHIDSIEFQRNEDNVQSNLLKLCLAMIYNSTYVSMNSVIIEKESKDLFMKEFVAAPFRTSFHYGPRSALSSSAFCLKWSTIAMVIQSYCQSSIQFYKQKNEDVDGKEDKKTDYNIEINYDAKKKRNVYKRVKKHSVSENLLNTGTRLNQPGVDINDDKLAVELFKAWRKRPFMLLSCNDHNVHDFRATVDDALHFDHKLIFITQAMVDRFDPTTASLGDVIFQRNDYLTLEYRTDPLRKENKARNALRKTPIRRAPLAFRVKSYFYQAITFMALDYKTMHTLRLNDTDATISHNDDPDGLTASGIKIKQGDISSILDMLPTDILAGLDISGLDT